MCVCVCVFALVRKGMETDGDDRPSSGPNAMTIKEEEKMVVGDKQRTQHTERNCIRIWQDDYLPVRHWRASVRRSKVTTTEQRLAESNGDRMRSIIAIDGAGRMTTTATMTMIVNLICRTRERQLATADDHDDDK